MLDRPRVLVAIARCAHGIHPPADPLAAGLSWHSRCPPVVPKTTRNTPSPDGRNGTIRAQTDDGIRPCPMRGANPAYRPTRHRILGSATDPAKAAATGIGAEAPARFPAALTSADPCTMVTGRPLVSDRFYERSISKPKGRIPDPFVVILGFANLGAMPCERLRSGMA